MARFSRLFLPAAALLALMLVVGCSDDESPADGGEADTTPPSVASVTPVDASHIDVTFNETVRREGAEDADNFGIVEGTPGAAAASSGAAPGDPLSVYAASLGTDGKTVTLTTAPMDVLPYDLSVTGVEDASGNGIVTPVTTSFTGTSDPDVTPPELVYRSPGPNATNVPIGASVLLTFSEQIPYDSFVNAFSWTLGANPVAFNEPESEDEGVHITVSASSPLEYATTYTVSLNGIEDEAGNTMPNTSWSFTTTSVVDQTPPTVVSSVPANGATNVDVNTNLSLTFSEAVNQASLEAQLTPDPGDADPPTWSNGGKTVTLDPYAPLLEDQQYTLSILPGGVQDLAGNELQNPVIIHFTTGGALASGRIRGTLSGDPNSDFADDPTGALVVAPNVSPFETDDFPILGSAVVAANNTYSIGNLPDDTYYPLAVMDTNGDDQIDPSTGDAIGMFGVDFYGGDMDPDSVIITGGAQVNNVDFPLIDPSAIVGTVYYEGAYSGGFYPILVGVFDVNGFDPTQPPDFDTEAYWPDYPEFVVSTLDQGLVDGTYYVGAFLDLDGEGDYDPFTEPAGLYGGTPPDAINIQNGSDALNVVIVMEDPAVPASGSTSVAWRVSEHRAPWLKALSAAIRRSVPERKW